MAISTTQAANEPLRGTEPGRLKHWMVVDDDLVMLTMTTRTLRAEIPNPVISYSDPLQALHAIEAAPGSFQVLVTDYNMPGMHGVDLSRRARAVCPGLKVLLASGTPFTRQEIANLGVHAFLPKPFIAEELIACLHTMLPDQIFPATSGREPQWVAQPSASLAVVGAGLLDRETHPAFVPDAMFVKK